MRAIILCEYLIEEHAHMQFKKEDLFTIPNILTYIRFICLPIFLAFMGLCFRCEESTLKTWWLFAGFITFIFAETTDIIDGKIARKYNMVTDIGKVIDPIADKLMQCFAILMVALVKNVWFVWVFMGVLIVKEVAMGVQSKYFMRASTRQVEQMANKVGKAGATINFIGIILTFGLNVKDMFGWFEMPDILLSILYYTDMVILLGACGLQIFAFFNYTRIYAKQLKALRESGVLDTLDKFGNPLPKDVDEKVVVPSGEDK